MNTKIIIKSKQCKNCMWFLLTSFLLLSGCYKNDAPAPDTFFTTNADKVEVIHFHGNRQCQSCILIGDLSQKAIKERLPQEYAAGIVTFKQINVDMPENKFIVTKFKARGSALFFNVIKDNYETKIEDTKVWRLIGDESEFMNHIATTIKHYLGK